MKIQKFIDLISSYECKSVSLNVMDVRLEANEFFFNRQAKDLSYHAFLVDGRSIFTFSKLCDGSEFLTVRVNSTMDYEVIDCIYSEDNHSCIVIGMTEAKDDEGPWYLIKFIFNISVR